MGEYKQFPIFDKPAEPTLEERLERKRRTEQRNAEVAAFHARAYLEMPASLRQDAERWGMSAFMDAVWQNAFACGYKQAQRDRLLPSPETDETEGGR